MRNNRRTLFVLFAAFIGLAVLMLLQNNQQNASVTPTPTSDRAFLRVFPDVAVLDIASIRLLNPNSSQTFTIGRLEDGSWTSPDGELEENAGTNIARTIALLPYESIVQPEDPGDLTGFGFAPSGYMFIQVLLVDGTSHTVAVGGLTPAGSHYFALVDDIPGVYLLVREAVAYLISQLGDPPIA